MALKPLAESGLTSWDDFPSITSPDALPGITSRRSRPRLLLKAALRPGTFYAGIATADAFRRIASYALLLLRKQTGILHETERIYVTLESSQWYNRDKSNNSSYLNLTQQ